MWMGLELKINTEWNYYLKLLPKKKIVGAHNSTLQANYLKNINVSVTALLYRYLCQICTGLILYTSKLGYKMMCLLIYTATVATMI